MWENLKIPLIVGGICLVLVFIFVYLLCKRHKNFINNAQNIHNGMSKDEVLSIMGQPTTEERDGNKLILIWEKNQWKGIQHGGTVTRAVKVIFVNNKVISVSNKNLDKSTFW